MRICRRRIGTSLIYSLLYSFGSGHVRVRGDNTDSNANEGGHGGNQDGFTLMEVLIAFAIVSLSFVLIMQLFAGGLRASRTSCDYTRAVVYAKDKMGEMMVNPEEGDGEFEDGFKWQSIVADYEEHEEEVYNLKKINVIVTWSDGSRKERKVEFISLKVVDSEES